MIKTGLARLLLISFCLCVTSSYAVFQYEITLRESKVHICDNYLRHQPMKDPGTQLVISKKCKSFENPTYGTESCLAFDEDILICSSPNYNDRVFIYATNVNGHSVIWHKNLPFADGPSAARALLSGNMVFINLGHAIHCLNSRTGEKIWERTLSSGWFGSSPTLAGTELVCLDDKLFIGFANESSSPPEGLLVSIDAKNGKELWKSRTYKPIGCLLGAKVAGKPWLAYAIYDDQGYYWYKRDEKGTTKPAGYVALNPQHPTYRSASLFYAKEVGKTPVLALCSAQRGKTTLTIDGSIVKTAEEISIIGTSGTEYGKSLLTLVKEGKEKATLVSYRVTDFKEQWRFCEGDLSKFNFVTTDSRLSIFEGAQVQFVINTVTGAELFRSAKYPKQELFTEDELRYETSCCCWINLPVHH